MCRLISRKCYPQYCPREVISRNYSRKKNIIQQIHSFFLYINIQFKKKKIKKIGQQKYMRIYEKKNNKGGVYLRKNVYNKGSFSSSDLHTS